MAKKGAIGRGSEDFTEAHGRYGEHNFGSKVQNGSFGPYTHGEYIDSWKTEGNWQGNCCKFRGHGTVRV